MVELSLSIAYFVRNILFDIADNLKTQSIPRDAFFRHYRLYSQLIMAGSVVNLMLGDANLLLGFVNHFRLRFVFGFSP